jgi:hypothetical protein
MDSSIPQFELGVLRQILAQLKAQTCLLKALVRGTAIEVLELGQLEAEVQQIIDGNTDTDVAELNVSNSPARDKGEMNMAGKVFGLGVPATFAMNDNQSNTATLAPVKADGSPASLAPGVLIQHVVAPGTALSIAPAADSLSYVATGIAGQAGTEVVTSTYTNPDGTVVSTTNTYTIGNPAALDVADFILTNGPATP